MASVQVLTRRKTLLVGGVVLGLIGFLLFLAITAQSGLPGVPTTTVKAAFANTDSLKVGDEVRRFSDRIGSVAAVEFEGGRAVVTMELDGERPVYRDASAEILDFSALAQKFVNLDVGTPAAGRLGVDEVIPERRNTSSEDLYELLEVLDRPTRDALTSTFREVGGGLRGHGRDLRDVVAAAPELVTDLGTVSSALAAPEADLPALLQNTDRLARRFVARRGDIERIVAEFGTTADAFAVDGAEPLRTTLQKLPGTLAAANEAVTSLQQPLSDTRQALAELRPGLDGLGQATPDLRNVLREAPQPLDKTPGVSELAEPALSELTDAVADARPLAPDVRQAFDDLHEPLDVLAPYGPELGFLIVRLHSFVSENVAGEPKTHYARVNAGVGPSTATGAVVPNLGAPPRNAYPDPGEATFDRAGAPGGN